MADKLVSVNENFDFPAPVAARQAEIATSRVGAEYWIDDINSFTLGPSTRTTWETPDGSGVACHPSVRFFPQGFNGYQWWAAATPYYNSNNQVENPCIFVSRDGVNWVAPPGVSNPLAASPPGAAAYNSDTHLIQAPNGKLFLFYRDLSDTGSAGEKIMLMESPDGITWSGPTEIYGTALAAQRLVSPAIWWDGSAQNWVMVGVDIVPSPRVIKRFTATDAYGPWTFDRIVTFDRAWPANRSPWHIDAMVLGTQILMTVQDTVGSGNGGDLYLAVSEDGGGTFKRAANPLATNDKYRSCVLPKITERGLALDMWIGTAHGDWAINRGTAAPPAPSALTAAQAATIDALSGNTEMLLAKSGISPYILGEDFNRPDSASGLGNAPTGQVWTNRTGVMTIAAGRAMIPAAGNTRAVTDLTVSNYEVSADIYPNPVDTSGHQGWLMVRVVDDNNYLRIGRAGFNVSLQRVTAGGLTILHDFGAPPPSMTKLTVKVVGDQITATVGTQQKTVTVTQGLTAKTIGLQITNPSVSVDNVTAKTA